VNVPQPVPRQVQQAALSAQGLPEQEQIQDLCKTVPTRHIDNAAPGHSEEITTTVSPEMPSVAGCTLSPQDLFKAPGLWCRMACFIYEGVLLFGVVMIAAYLFSSLTQQRHALEGRHGLQAFLFVVLAIYFSWFWSRGGQTVAMKAWHIQLIEIRGNQPYPVSQARALVRYVLSWLWWLPGPLLLSLSGIQGGLAVIVTLLVGVVAYALLSQLHPQKQFWHDVVCGTRLVTKQ
jgi:uncharacterized RDD family membrane protein YckC